MGGAETRSLSELYIDKSIDPRSTKRSQEKIEQYACILALLPPIDIDQRNRILDGVHRYLAHKLAERDEINVKVFTYEKEVDAVRHAYRANSKHGVPLTESDIKQTCIRLCEFGYTNKQIANIIEVKSEHSVGRYVKETRERRENELASKVGELYEVRDDSGKRIYTHKKLAEEIGQSTHRVSDLLDRYYANQIKAASKTQTFDDDELLEKFNITDKQLTRINERYGDFIYPPPPEPEPEDPEVFGNEPEADSELTLQPEPQEGPVDVGDKKKDKETDRTHSEMQWMLLWLGNELNLNLWLPKKDHTESHRKSEIANLSGMLKDLPFSILKAGRSIPRIDVLWLKDSKIIAAFEIENSTGIESGLFRMSHMWVSMEDASIRTHIVASDGDVNKARDNIIEPTFKHNGLAESCWFIAYTELTKKYNEAEQRGTIPDNWEKLLDAIGHKL